jgi:two-component system phosphate regulon sensor histidine kinase PhoR
MALRQPLLLDAVESVYRDAEPRETRYVSREAGRDTTYLARIARADAVVVISFEDQTALQDVGQLRRDFVANVSHELRTPLTALLGFIETLRGAAKDDLAARERFLGIMEREAGRMARLVDDLLSLSRVEVEERVRPSQTVDLGAIVQSTLAELQPVLETAGVKATVTDDSGAQGVRGDAGQLRQVIGNLIENAAKYGAKGGVVEIMISAPGPMAPLRDTGIMLRIIDKGDGIAAHHIPRLTERFYRADTHRSREVGGTGLGLAIVKHIVNRHRGRLQFESKLGQGTTVTVYLPLG